MKKQKIKYADPATVERLRKIEGNRAATKLLLASLTDRLAETEKDALAVWNEVEIALKLPKKSIWNVHLGTGELMLVGKRK